MPILFAHRGGRAHGPGNALATFRSALEAGLTAVETDVRLTADRVPVLVHGTTVGLLRRVPLRRVASGDLPHAVATLDQLFDLAGPGVDVSLDLKDADALEPVLDVAQRHGIPLPRLWLCGTRRQIEAWRPLTGANLVESTRLRVLGGDLSAAAGAARHAGADVLNLPLRDWVALRPAAVTAIHARGLRAFGWGAHRAGGVKFLAGLGLDGIYGDRVPALLGVRGDPQAG